MVRTERAPRWQQFHAEPAMSTTEQLCITTSVNIQNSLCKATATHSELHTTRAQWRCRWIVYVCSYKHRFGVTNMGFAATDTCSYKTGNVTATASGICRLCVHLSSGLFTAVDTVPVLKRMWMHWLPQTLLVLFSTFSSSNIPKMVFDFQFAFWLEIGIM